MVDRLIDANVGDEIWVFEGEKSRHDANGKYIGRGAWSRYPVKKVARKYLNVGWLGDFDRTDGSAREVSGFRPNNYAAGDVDKANHETLKLRNAVGRRVQDLEDVYKLRAIIEILDTP